MCRFGRRVLELQIGAKKVPFSVHEDLLCSQSGYFKLRFQKNRRDIEGDCPICQEEVESVIADVTYCKECGQNLHTACMSKWLRNSKTCPMCRAEWMTKTACPTTKYTALDPEAFEVYYQWLYSARFPIYNADKKDPDARCLRLLKSHLLGSKLDDAIFQKAVVKEIIRTALSNTAVIRCTAVRYAYKSTTGPCILREFMVDMYAICAPSTSLKDESFPHEFVRDLAQALLDSRREEKRDAKERLTSYLESEDDDE